MTHLLRALSFTALLAFTAAPAAEGELTPDETDARKIMEAVENRADGDKVTSKMKMVIKDASGRERTRTMRSRSLDLDGGTKQLILFEAPPTCATRACSA